MNPPSLASCHLHLGPLCKSHHTARKESFCVKQLLFVTRLPPLNSLFCCFGRLKVRDQIENLPACCLSPSEIEYFWLLGFEKMLWQRNDLLTPTIDLLTPTKSCTGWAPWGRAPPVKRQENKGPSPRLTTWTSTRLFYVRSCHRLIREIASVD